MWDNVLFISFIICDKVWEERLCGMLFEIFFVKVGGKEEKISFRKYKLLFIDFKGEMMFVEVCEIDKIIIDI